MDNTRTYLDSNATAVVRPAVADAVAVVIGRTGNPSSVHGEGRGARALIETAREEVAALVGARPQDVVFTSGGTEGANALLAPGALAGAGQRLIVLASEHACVLDGHGYAAADVTTLPVGSDGVADLDRLAQLLGEGGPAVVAIQAANSETGVLQTLGRAAELVHRANGLLIADAVQAAGKVPLTIADLGADAVILSAHKLGGLQGVGAMVLAGDHVRLARPLLRGGGQERGQRAGTQNVPGIVAFGIAARIATETLADEAPRLTALRDRLEALVRQAAPDAVVFGAGAERLPNTSAFAVPGLMAETLLMHFDRAGIALSSGSACSSGKIKRSHVLAAMGIDSDLAGGALRASLGWHSTADDVVRFGQTFEKAIGTLHRRTGARRAA